MGDYFNDDEAFAKYEQQKDYAEQLKKQRVDKILDEYCYT